MTSLPTLLNLSSLEKPEVNENLVVSAPVIPEQVTPVLPAKQIAPVQAGSQSLLEPIDPPHAKNAAQITKNSEVIISPADNNDAADVI